MKIFVFAYNRFETMTTPSHLAREGIEHIVLCHSEEDRQRFIDKGVAQKSSIIATGNPRGLTKQRNYALSLMEEGEWALFMNDDFIKVQIITPYYKDYSLKHLPITLENQTHYRHAFNNTVSLNEFLDELPRIIKESEQEGIYLVGFALHDNTLARKKRVSYSGLADGRCWLLRKTHLRFDEEVNALEDRDFTAQNLITFGKLRIENWICPYFSRLTKGGFGLMAEREQERTREVYYLLNKYPHLFMTKEKKGFPVSLQFRNLIHGL